MIDLTSDCDHGDGLGALFNSNDRQGSPAGRNEQPGCGEQVGGYFGLIAWRDIRGAACQSLPLPAEEGLIAAKDG